MTTDIDTVEIEPQGHLGGDPAATPVVIFFHGRGLDPVTVHTVAPAFRKARIVAPQGGLALRRGTTWFDNERIGVAKPESVAEAEARFLGWLAGRYGDRTPIWLCGFSNGGAFAAHLIMRHPALFRGAVLLSAPLVLPPWPERALAGQSVFYGRGNRDEIVSSAAFDAGEAYLCGPSGAETIVGRYDMAHEITADELADVGAWFDQRVASPAGATPTPFRADSE